MSDRPGGAMQVWPVIKWTGVYTLLQQWDVDYRAEVSRGECYVVRCYGGRDCYEAGPLCNYLVRAGGQGGIRPSRHQHSPSKAATSPCRGIWLSLLPRTSLAPKAQ